MSPVERAQAKIDRMMGDGKPEGEGNDKPSQEQAATNEPQEQAPQEQQEQQANRQQEEPRRQEAPREPAVRQNEPSRDQNDQSWEQKYKSLHGMFAGMRAKIDGLEEQNALLMQRLESKPQQQAPASNDNVLSGEASNAELAAHIKQLSDDYGEDFVNIMRTVMRAEFNGMIDQRLKPVTEKVQRSQEDSQRARQENFANQLTARVPDWRELWNNPEFQVWLDTNREDFSGRSYQELFRGANKDWNLDGMVRFFETFKRATGRVAATQQGVGQTHQSSDPREDLVAPGKSSGSNNNPQQGQKKIWTMLEVNQFYKDVQTGKYRGREADYQKIDAEIFQANREGRIR